MVVNSSNLCLRFYKSQGWTLELLNSLVTKGQFIKHPSFDKDESTGFGGYFINEIGTEINIPELLKHTTKVIRAYNDRPDESDSEFIQRML